MLTQEFRDLMAGVCAPVTVITTGDADGPHGATVSSLASLSLRPALLSIALDQNSQLLGRIRATGRFGVNVLSATQDDVATAFASRGVDRFGTTGWSTCDGLPRLDDIAGWASCDVTQTVEAGDHLLLVGTVTRAASVHRPPLVYAHRTFGTHSRYAARPRPTIVDQITACAV
ncbi:flavin reductase [Gordonia desulfuricans]|uniref:Flavin reductase n=1 Tax=Gordonia desulfuricans TaxID=89051 RepID=A0A7K3LL38_9ACTN|nr:MULTISPECIES: flavin reductase family protein [Gordonia]EMP12871.2 flavin reductase [Gordonia sp. NB41Y]NDK88873.1 flavin reductase [Gordonia desulfuricans]WLP88888.1 flavin reductase family protein [Gordonia sp. NB41Y]